MRRLSFLIALAFLSACSSLPKAPTQAVVWQEHQDTISTIQQWQLQGRLNIRSENESNTISISWQQSSDNFLINLSGALGLGAIQIEGNDQGVKVEKSGEAPVFANNLEEIGRDYLGYDFPASQLQYWIRGIPSPEASNSSYIQLNDKQLLESLQQGEWQLQYGRYQTQDSGLTLPKRITMAHSPFRLTFIISNWQL